MRGISKRAIAIALARAGHPVGFCFASDTEGAGETQTAVEAEGTKALAVKADVRDPASVDAAFSAVEAEFGGNAELEATRSLTVADRIGEMLRPHADRRLDHGAAIFHLGAHHIIGQLGENRMVHRMSADRHQRGGSGSGQPIRGVTRLVNPPEDDHEVISGEEDPVERDYLGRILHVVFADVRGPSSDCGLDRLDRLGLGGGDDAHVVGHTPGTSCRRGDSGSHRMPIRSHVAHG